MVRSRPYLDCLPRLVCVAVAILWFEGVLPNPVEASCGHWLAGPATDQEDQAASSSHPDRSVRCQGPSCQRNSMAPFPAAPQRQIPPDRENWCVGDSTGELTPGLQLLGQIEPSPHCAAGHARRVERPPCG